jgi:sirohydrochlorin cobaltochelatase
MSALLIIGHGSTLNPDSSAPTHAQADELRKCGVFDEVVCAFWKEEPSLREALYMIASDFIWVVPNFISEGYFTREVLPRELQLEGSVTRRNGKTIVYCDPVGSHSSMTRLLVKRADEVALGVRRSETSLIVAGHGTSLNDLSRKAIELQVARIRDGGHGFAEVLDAYMEEEPFVAKWHEFSRAPNVVVVPFFIADGLHSYQDIPVLLGLESKPTAAASETDVFRQNPYEIRGRRVYYTSAIGTEPLMAGVILDQVYESCQRHGFARPSLRSSRTNVTDGSWPIARGAFVIGQIQVAPQPEDGWLLHHINDHPDNPAQATLFRPTDARTLSLCDDQGVYRKLKSAPNLRCGWKLCLASRHELHEALNFFYPGALGFLQHWQTQSLRPVHLRETLERQTGMFRWANQITDCQAQAMIARECDLQTKCLRRITWRLSAQQPLAQLTSAKLSPTAVDEGGLPLLCVEACTHIVSAALELTRPLREKSAVPGMA